MGNFQSATTSRASANRWRRSGFLLLALLAIAACADKRPAPVKELRQSDRESQRLQAIDKNAKTYRVRPGDTLYSIAFRYGLDYKTLARVNGINSRYIIRPGQVLRLDKARYAGRSRPSVSRPVVASRSTGKSPPRPRPPTASGTTTGKSPTRTTTPPKKSPVSSPQPPRITATGAVDYWIWPSTGNVLQGFVNARSGNKGIDISGQTGEKVSAAAGGRVVYAGNGLRGYGQLVIIKHNADFLSAYAHNRRILVKEDELVKAGQKIAEMGSSDTDRTKLHFEIRYRGQPVDPLKYLPRR